MNDKERIAEMLRHLKSINGDIILFAVDSKGFTRNVSGVAIEDAIADALYQAGVRVVEEPEE